MDCYLHGKNLDRRYVGYGEGKKQIVLKVTPYWNYNCFISEFGIIHTKNLWKDKLAGYINGYQNKREFATVDEICGEGVRETCIRMILKHLEASPFRDMSNRERHGAPLDVCALCYRHTSPLRPHDYKKYGLHRMYGADDCYLPQVCTNCESAVKRRTLKQKEDFHNEGVAKEIFTDIYHERANMRMVNIINNGQPFQSHYEFTNLPGYKAPGIVRQST